MALPRDPYTGRTRVQRQQPPAVPPAAGVQRPPGATRVEFCALLAAAEAARERAGGETNTRTRTLSDVPGEQAAGRAGALRHGPPLPAARQPSGELTRQGWTGVGLAPPQRGWRRPRAYLVPSIPPKKAVSRRGLSSVGGCRLPVSESVLGPRPGGAGGVPLVSRAEPEPEPLSAAGSAFRVARPAGWAGRGAAGPQHRTGAGRPAGRGQTRRSTTRRGTGWQRPSRAAGWPRAGTCLPGTGGPPSPAERTTLREGRSAPPAAIYSSFQRRREPGPRRR